MSFPPHQEPWYYEDIPAEVDDFEEPEADSDFDYEESYSSKKKPKKKPPVKTPSKVCNKPLQTKNQLRLLTKTKNLPRRAHEDARSRSRSTTTPPTLRSLTPAKVRNLDAVSGQVCSD